MRGSRAGGGGELKRGRTGHGIALAPGGRTGKCTDFMDISVSSFSF